MSNAGHVSGKVAVVTGGARGMGAAHVRALAREGAIVAATDIIDDLGASLAEQLQSEGRDVSYYHHDVTSRAGWEAVVASVQQAHGPIDVLVNNAGVQVRSVRIEADDREWDPVTGVNQRGVFLGMRAPDTVHALKKQMPLGATDAPRRSQPVSCSSRRTNPRSSQASHSRSTAGW